MIEELDIVLQGKPTCIKNKTYLSARQYIQPFVDRLTPLGAEFKCYVRPSEQSSITDGTIDTVYNRVCIQAILPTTYYQRGVYQKVICMVYALDSKIPVAKFYIGDINIQQGTIIVTNSNQIRMQKIEPDTALDYSCIQRLLELTDDIHALMEPNLSLPIDRQDLFGLLGLWVDKTLDCVYSSEYGKVKIANSVPLDAYKSILKDKDSDWYVPSTHGIHMRDIYNCLLHLIQKDDKDIVNQFEKTMLINNILGL